MSLWLQLYKYIFMTSLMTSPGNNIIQILKLIYLPSIFELQRRSNTQNVRNAHGYRSGKFNFRYKTSGKKRLSRAQNGGHFKKDLNIKHSFNLTSHMIRSSQIMPKKVFYNGDGVIDDVTGWPQSFSLYSCLEEVDLGSKLQGQCLVNKCQYHNCLSRLYMPKNDLNE